MDKIASDYIRPAEGTLDFALMYIPAENIYYETMIQCDGDSQDILHYCLDKKVIPVSPNLLYAYLMTVAMGLHGLQIEQQAAEIRRNLRQLNSSFAEFVCRLGHPRHPPPQRLRQIRRRPKTPRPPRPATDPNPGGRELNGPSWGRYIDAYCNAPL